MDSSKSRNAGPPPEPWWYRIHRRLAQWHLYQYAARGMAYSVGSGAVSLVLLWCRSRY